VCAHRRGERAFCAGSDLKFAATSESGIGAGKRAYPRSGYGGIAERFDLSKPVIAAVNGVALGGGFEIVLACDLVIAADTALFGLPEPLVGAIALGGGLHRLARQIGLKSALGIILTGRKVGAVEGKAFGFVNEVVTRAELAPAVDRWTADILRCSPVATQASKEVVYRGLAEPSLADAMRNQRDYEDFAPGWSLTTYAKDRALLRRSALPTGPSLEAVAGVATNHDDWKMALSRFAADRDTHGLFAVPRPPPASVGQQDLLDMR